MHARDNPPTTNDVTTQPISTSCAARWPAQYAPAPADRRPILGQFVVRGQELPTAYVRAKFEDRSFTRLRNIEGSQNFEIGSRTPGHANLGANLWSGGKNCPRPMCMPNLKSVAFSVCEILRGSQNFEIGSRAPGVAQFRGNLWSGGKNCPRPMSTPNLKIVALPVCEILRGSQNFEIGSRTPGHAHLGANL